MNDTKEVFIGVRVEADLAEAVRRRAERDQTSMSRVIRDVIRRTLVDTQRKPATSEAA